MNPIIIEKTIDLSSNNNFDYIRAIQGDDKTRYVHITLLDNQVPYELSNIEPVLRGTKPDGHTIFNHCEISENNEIIVELDSQILAHAGKSEYEIALYGTDELNECLTSFPFILYISPAKFDPGDVISSDEFKELTSIIKNVGVINKSVENAEKAAKSSLDSANKALEYSNDSKQYAEDSKSYSNDSEQYSINSSNYADQSLEYANDSKSSSELSEQMATNSSNYADQSLEYAEYSEQKSVDSANSALLSKSYANGDTGIRENENNDNAKFYAEQASNSNRSASVYLTKVEEAGNQALEAINNALSMNIPIFNFEPSNGHLYYEGGRFQWLLDDDGHLYWEVVL